MEHFRKKNQSFWREKRCRRDLGETFSSCLFTPSARCCLPRDNQSIEPPRKSARTETLVVPACLLTFCFHPRAHHGTLSRLIQLAEKTKPVSTPVTFNQDTFVHSDRSRLLSSPNPELQYCRQQAHQATSIPKNLRLLQQANTIPNTPTRVCK